MDLPASLARRVRRRPRDRLDAPLAPLTTLPGRRRRRLAASRCTSDAELVARVSARARRTACRVTMLGGGSNVLVGDAGVRGVVVPGCATRAIAREDAAGVRAEAGVTINGLVRWTIGRGLRGPRGVGRHAGHGRRRDLTATRTAGREHRRPRGDGRACSTRGGERRDDVPAAEMAFGYDTQPRCRRPARSLLSAVFTADAGDDAGRAARDRARVAGAIASARSRCDVPSAGCIFQNPDPARRSRARRHPVRRPARWSIAPASRGEAIGGARISPLHANFIVNDGGATARRHPRARSSAAEPRCASGSASSCATRSCTSADVLTDRDGRVRPGDSASCPRC